MAPTFKGGTTVNAIDLQELLITGEQLPSSVPEHEQLNEQQVAELLSNTPANGE